MAGGAGVCVSTGGGNPDTAEDTFGCKNGPVEVRGGKGLKAGPVSGTPVCGGGSRVRWRAEEEAPGVSAA